MLDVTRGLHLTQRLRPLSYSKSHVILIAFAIDTPDSLENVTVKWIEEVRSICGSTIPVLLVGCKSGTSPFLVLLPSFHPLFEQPSHFADHLPLALATRNLFIVRRLFGAETPIVSYSLHVTYPSPGFSCLPPASPSNCPRFFLPTPVLLPTPCRHSLAHTALPPHRPPAAGARCAGLRLPRAGRAHRGPDRRARVQGVLRAVRRGRRRRVRGRDAREHAHARGRARARARRLGREPDGPPPEELGPARRQPGRRAEGRRRGGGQVLCDLLTTGAARLGCFLLCDCDCDCGGWGAGDVERRGEGERGTYTHTIGHFCHVRLIGRLLACLFLRASSRRC
jgi:hypothetical protein